MDAIPFRASCGLPVLLPFADTLQERRVAMCLTPLLSTSKYVRPPTQCNWRRRRSRPGGLLVWNSTTTKSTLSSRESTLVTTAQNGTTLHQIASATFSYLLKVKGARLLLICRPCSFSTYHLVWTNLQICQKTAKRGKRLRAQVSRAMTQSGYQLAVHALITSPTSRHLKRRSISLPASRLRNRNTKPSLTCGGRRTSSI